MLQLLQTPELAAEVTLQPVRRFGPDGAIIFADILTPLIGMGMKLDFIEGVGPRFENPVRSISDIRALQVPEDCWQFVGYTLRALQMVRESLQGTGIATLGFSGAPFTLSTYLLQDKSKEASAVKCFMCNEPAAWEELQQKLVTLTVEYLVAQVDAGAEALQLFDTWIGVLPTHLVIDRVFPTLCELLERLRQRVSVPITYFSTNSAHLFSAFRTLPVECFSIDWRASLPAFFSQLTEGGSRVPPTLRAIQGNLDPAFLQASVNVMQAEVLRVLAEGAALGVKHVFNLGHGVMPESRLENLTRLFEVVRSYRYSNCQESLS
jgi:uroporphyrinogen decarboxylase